MQLYREATVKLINTVGLHARPATLFVEVGKKFKSNILVEKNGVQVDGKSILGILRLSADSGSIIKIHAEGEDAAEAVQELVSIIERRFGEE